MKKSLLFALMVGMLPLTANAASEDECSIWLCLPTGFPSGCEGAKSAFKDRVKHLKSPLPGFIGCATQTSEHASEMTYQEGAAAKMPDGSYIDGTRCNHYWDAPNDKWRWEPHGCIGTYYYIDTYEDGNLYGDRYYYQY
ncbi:TPA: conjugal transfer protein [Vibrio parahaemolyticus]